MNNKKPVIGVIGGIGPHASLDLVHKIMNNTEASKDEDHIPIILQSIPNLIPDRNDFILNKSTLNPAQAILDSIKSLASIGADTFVIACNAAHSPEIFTPIKNAFDHQFQALTLLSIVDSVAEEIKSDPAHKFGIMSVIGTYHSEIYHDAIEKVNKNVIRLPKELRLKVHDLICHEDFGIKSSPDNITDVANDCFKQVAGYFASKNVEKVLLACTELPLIDTLEIESNLGLSFMDVTNVFARYIVNKIYPEKLKSFT